MNIERRSEFGNTQTVVDTLVGNFRESLTRYPLVTRLMMAGLFSGYLLGTQPGRANADTSQSPSASPSEQAVVVQVPYIGFNIDDIKSLSQAKEEIPAKQTTIPDLTKVTVQLAAGTNSSAMVEILTKDKLPMKAKWRDKQVFPPNNNSKKTKRVKERNKSNYLRNIVVTTF